MNTLNNLIKFFVLCGVIAFVLGFVNLWAFLAAFIFGGAAMVCGILKNMYK
jgi:hypothetical protein